MRTARDKCLLLSDPSVRFVGGQSDGADRLNGLSAYVLRIEINKYSPYLDVEQRVLYAVYRSHVYQSLFWSCSLDATLSRLSPAEGLLVRRSTRRRGPD